MKTDWIKPSVIAVVIPVAIALGYSLTYAFERGYCDVFEIPPDLIALDTNNILFAISTIFILLSLSIFIWYPYIFIPLAKLSQRWGSKISYLAGGLFCIVVLALLYRDVLSKWLPVLIIIVIASILWYIIPIIGKSFKRAYDWITKKFSRKRDDQIQHKQEEIDTQPAIVEESSGMTNRRVVSLSIMFLILLYSFAFITGQAQAEMQEEYY